MNQMKRRYVKTWEMYCADTKCRGNMMSIDPEANKTGRNCPYCGKPMRNRRVVVGAPAVKSSNAPE
jgi:hypothetical protein